MQLMLPQKKRTAISYCCCSSEILSDEDVEVPCQNDVIGYCYYYRHRHHSMNLPPFQELFLPYFSIPWSAGQHLLWPLCPAVALKGYLPRPLNFILLA